jgi:DNA recombination protein RmuC|tara:strand:- start:3201 stop:4499 length:1299 start_codon:yes stop_codon:yes gene_type:complete
MMTDLLIYLIIIIASIFIGLFLGRNSARLKFQKEQATLEERNTILNKSIQDTSDDMKASQTEKEILIASKIRLETELKNSEKNIAENKEELEKLQEKFTKEFENLANKILEEKSTKFTEQNKLNMNNILTPLKEKIEGFEKKVTESQKESIGMHSALKEQLNNLKDLNLQMSKEAINLTKALKGDSKAQGDWGETQLEILLEKANLAKDIHFKTQGGYRDEEGRLKKPDFIINLPDNRHLIVDSKVSLTNYEAYFNEENEIQKEIHLKKHIESIRKHIKELSEKKYESLYEINTPDYVLMFVPIEPAYLLALNKNNQLYMEALDKNVVLVSTSTLLATLSTVASMWRQENQKKNVLEIANQAGRLYDQFVNLTDDLIKVGNQLKTVQGSYDSSMKKLTGKGNLIKKVENIKQLGAKTSKVMNKNLLDRATED